MDCLKFQTKKYGLCSVFNAEERLGKPLKDFGWNSEVGISVLDELNLGYRLGIYPRSRNWQIVNN